MPGKQVEDVYNAGGFDGGPLGRPGRQGSKDMVATIKVECDTMNDAKAAAAAFSDFAHDTGWSVKPGMFARAEGKMGEGKRFVVLQFAKAK